MKLLKASKKGLHVAIMVATILSMSGVGGFIAPETAQAVDTGYKSPTANSSNGSGDDWSDPQNAYSDGNGYAYEENNESHRYYNFNFNVPVGSTINGVKVKADARSTDSSGCKLGVDLSWNGGSNWVSEKTVLLTGSEVTHSFGNTSDTWGRTWDATDFANANFRARVHDIDPGNNCSNNRTTKLDWIRILVDYTEVLAYCGDGILQPENGEVCESGDTQKCTTQDEYEGVQSCFMGNKTSDNSDQQLWCTWNEACEPVEFCGDEKINGSEQCDGGDNCTEQCTYKPAVIDPYKIICPAETDLPDWGVNDNIKPDGTPKSITSWVESGDIYTWVEENGCEFARDWDFEWAYDPEGNPGDNNDNNTDVDWNTFNVGSPLELTDLGNGKIWVREQVDPAYIPFSSTLNPTEPQNSAEMYCDTDILNYDNYEWISGLEYGETYNCVGFNVLKTGSIQGSKWNDLDGDGKWQETEPGMPWKINLYQDDQLIKTQTGDEDGWYKFDVPYGTYKVCENMSPIWTPTYPATEDGCHIVNVPNTQPPDGSKGFHFGNNTNTYNIHGYKWHDANADGDRNCAVPTQDNLDFRSALIEELPEPTLCEEYSENLLPNWTIFIDSNNNGVHDEEKQSTQTDETGMYSFDGLQAGTYRICEVQQEGWEQTHPLNAEINNCHMVTVPKDQEVFTEYNFGNRTIGDPTIEKTVVVTGGESEAAEIGDTLTYTITVTNNFDTDIPDLLVEDTLPEHLTLVAGSFTGDLTPSSISGDTYQWGTFTVLENSSVSMSFEATIDDDITEDTTIDNIAILYRQVAVEDEETEVSFLNQLFGIKTAHAATFELVYIAQANAEVNVTIPETIIPETPTTPTTPTTPGIVLGETTKPVLEITKTTDAEFANPGDTVSYIVVVKNTGDGQALGVSVTDTLPNGFTFADGSGTIKTWFLGALDVDAQKSIVYDVLIGNVEPGKYQNIAVVSADNADAVQTTATLEVKKPAVLGDSVPSTGITFRDYAIFISSLLLIAAGALFIYRGRQFADAK